MRWFQSKSGKKKRRTTDWEFFDGYPPHLRMRMLKDGVWEVRQATEEEMQEFMASEAAFVSRSPSTSSPATSADALNRDDKNFPADAEQETPASSSEPSNADKRS